MKRAFLWFCLLFPVHFVLVTSALPQGGVS